MEKEGEERNLRPRDQLRPPAGLMATLETDQSRTEAQIRRKRSGKKSSITRRIQEIDRIIKERGSRTKLQFLREGLEEVWKEAIELHEQLMQHLDQNDKEFSDDWIEELGIKVNTCLSNIHDYMIQRQNDPPSIESQFDAGSLTGSANRNQIDDESLAGSYLNRATQERKIDLLKWNNGESGYSLQNGNAATQPGPTDNMALTGVQSKFMLTPGDDFQKSALQKESEERSMKMELQNLVSREKPLVDEFKEMSSAFKQMSLVDNKDVTETYQIGSQQNVTSMISSHHPVNNGPLGNYEPMVNPYTKITASIFNAQQRNTTSTYVDPSMKLRLGTSYTKGSRLNVNTMAPTEIASSEFLRPIISHIQAANERPYDAKTTLTAVDTNTGLKEPVNTFKIPSSKNIKSPHISEKPIDSWIDDLDPSKPDEIEVLQYTPDEMPMRLLAQQRLPHIVITPFDGSPDKWIEFVIQFHENVHCQPYLTIVQKRTYLLQYLKGEPKRAVQGYGNDKYGYYNSLKRLKYMFGQREAIAQVILNKITRGKQIANHDVDELNKFYYTISDCLHTLRRMRYFSDLYSSDVLRQAVQRLPYWLKNKWAEYCFIIRRTDEPNLIHFEKWLQDRVMAMKDPCLKEFYANARRSKGQDDKQKFSTMHSRIEEEIETKEKSKRSAEDCSFCEDKHKNHKCPIYLKKSIQERLSAVKQRKLCFNCLKSHQVRKCTSKLRCFHSGCKKSHHTSLHEAFASNTNGKNEKKTVKEKSNNKPGKTKKTSNVTPVVTAPTLPVVTSNHISTKRRVYLKVVPVKIHGQHGLSVNTYALLDGASQSTLIRKDLADKLKLKGDQQFIMLGGVKDEGEKMQVKRVEFKLSSLDEESTFHVEHAYAIIKERFKMPSQYLPKDFNENESLSHLHGLGITDVEPEDVQLLVGADTPSALWCTEVKAGSKNTPLAIKTPFGWAIFGVLEQQTEDNIQTRTYATSIKIDEDLNKKLESFWTTEAFGTKFNEQSSLSIQDQNCIKHLERNTKLVNGHYVVPMLWANNINLPNNYGVARYRLQNLIKKLKRDDWLRGKYKENIEKHLKSGLARKLTATEASKSTEKTWYLPHHAVVHPNKPEKVRTVFDAASKYQGQSLNSCLLTGPDLLNNLVGVLLRFRNHPIAIVADIEAMFMQVRITEEDRDAVRFLWQDDMNSTDSPQVYQMLYHILGAKDSPCCASYALRKTAMDYEQDFAEETKRTVFRNFYMDDLIKSVKDTKQAVELSYELIKMLSKGGFNLTKFNSNSPHVLKQLPESAKAPSHQMNFDDNQVERALGIQWMVKKDVFTFTSVKKDLPPTKRNILSITSSIFDPLGFLSPFILNAKILLQELWRRKYTWDAAIDHNLQKTWFQWTDQLSQLQNISIPRCYGSNCDPEIIELHIFSDASESAFASAAYIRIKDVSGSFNSSLIMAKSRLAPLRAITIPRLELQGAVLSARMKEFILKEIDLNFDSIMFWTDSMTTLQYIYNETRRFKTFVANRVTEIREVTDVESWKHVDGKENPADLATRGMLLDDLKSNDLWFNGPSFLQSNMDLKASVPQLDNVNDEDLEIKRSNVYVNISLPSSILSTLQNLDRWEEVVTTIAWAKRFFTCVLSKDPPVNEIPSSQERVNSEKTLLKLIQKDTLGAEMEATAKGKELPKNSPLVKLDPYVDKEGLMRVGGRLINANLPCCSRQIILPSDHPIVEMLIQHVHRTNAHCGREYLLSILRQNYWVIKSRPLIKKVIHRCFICAKRRAKAKPPFMANIPTARLAINCPPFYNTGIDYFGPLYVVVKRSKVKRWGCIFTCMTTRGIHLEVADTLSTDSFINTLERFINRRGQPNCIFSDNGSNFRGAERELREELESLNQERISAFSARNKFTWKFNPPEAPHMGGAWERMVQTVKRSLKIILKEQLVNDFTLMTVFTEVEALVNSRPMTYVSEDINDYEPLTPNHFILGRPSKNLNMATIYEDDVNHRKRWRRSQALANQFWKRWLTEYLPTLTIRSKWTSKTANVNVGDLVLMNETNTPRGKWPLGRVTKLFPGDDGIVRVVDVTTKDGTYRRPMTKICVIDS